MSRSARPVRMFTCSLCGGTACSSSQWRPEGWRVVWVKLDGRRLQAPLSRSEPAEHACSDACVARLIELHEDLLRAAWDDEPAFPRHHGASDEPCGSCGRERPKMRFLDVQVAGELDCTFFSSSQRDGASPVGASPSKSASSRIPLVCSAECAARWLRSCAAALLTGAPPPPERPA